MMTTPNASRLRKRLEELEDRRARLNTASFILHQASKDGRAAQVAALSVLGLSEHSITQLLEPGFAERVGFPRVELSDINAQVRRLNELLKQANKEQQR